MTTFLKAKNLAGPCQKSVPCCENLTLFPCTTLHTTGVLAVATPYPSAVSTHGLWCHIMVSARPMHRTQHLSCLTLLHDVIILQRPVQLALHMPSTWATGTTYMIYTPGTPHDALKARPSLKFIPCVAAPASKLSPCLCDIKPRPSLDQFQPHDECKTLCRAPGSLTVHKWPLCSTIVELYTSLPLTFYAFRPMIPSSAFGSNSWAQGHEQEPPTQPPLPPHNASIFIRMLTCKSIRLA